MGAGIKMLDEPWPGIGVRLQIRGVFLNRVGQTDLSASVRFSEQIVRHIEGSVLPRQDETLPIRVLASMTDGLRPLENPERHAGQQPAKNYR